MRGPFLFLDPQRTLAAKGKLRVQGLLTFLEAKLNREDAAQR
jgi:hypothetical protein